MLTTIGLIPASVALPLCFDSYDNNVERDARFIMAAELVDHRIFAYLLQGLKCTRIGEKRCNCSCFEIDQEMDSILIIIGIVYGVCRIIIKSLFHHFKAIYQFPFVSQYVHPHLCANCITTIGLIPASVALPLCFDSYDNNIILVVSKRKSDGRPIQQP
jgi:hypothetical protein